MSREFLTWCALEVWYQLVREICARQGAIVSREAFVNLPVIPVMLPGAAAELFGAGLAITGIQVLTQIMPNRPLASPNGRN